MKVYHNRIARTALSTSVEQVEDSLESLGWDSDGGGSPVDTKVRTESKRLCTLGWS
jgi:hypothetical protein